MLTRHSFTKYSFLEKVLRVSPTDGVVREKERVPLSWLSPFYGSNNKILIFGNISDVVVDLRYRYFHNSARCIPLTDGLLVSVQIYLITLWQLVLFIAAKVRFLRKIMNKDSEDCLPWIKKNCENKLKF